MKAENPVPIIDFISNTKKTFEIPVYQRNYVWKKDDCVRLFEDVIAGISGNHHYFGNIVFFEIETIRSKAYTRFALIDGQQRITSTMLLIAAIRDEITDPELQKDLTNNYLRNEDAAGNLRIKLKQVETDRSVFEELISGNIDGLDKSTIIFQNYRTFRLLVNKSFEDGISAEKLLDGISKLEVILIDLQVHLPGAESPQVIFESINATGEPLATADLLRNYLLMVVGIDKQEDFYKNYWLTIEQNIGNSNISDFIRRYLTLKRSIKKGRAEDVKKDTEYVEFKRNYKEYFENAEEALVELTHFSKYYRWIKSPEVIAHEYPATSAILTELNELRMVPAIPAILWLLEKADSGQIPFEDVNETLDVIGDWSFRARVSNTITSADIGRIQLSLLDILLEKQGEGSYGQYILFELSNYAGRDIYPNNEEFTEAFIKYDFYKENRNYVQQKLENSLRERAHIHDKVQIELESIEHIMPQTLRDDKWPDISVSEHAEWVNTIGNLTPMNMIDNPAASNDSIENKRQYIEKSAWQLTKEIDTSEGWGIEQILKRGLALAKQACEIWRSPIERSREIEAKARAGSNERINQMIKWINDFDLPELQIIYSSASYIRFNSDFMSKLIPTKRAQDGVLRYGLAYYYELVHEPNGWTRVRLSFNSQNSTEEQQVGRQKVMDFLKKYPPKEDWVWFTPTGWEVNYEDGDDVLREELERIFTVVIPRFEHDLSEWLTKPQTPSS